MTDGDATPGRGTAGRDGPASRASPSRGDGDRDGERAVASPVVTTTVRLLTPFVVTFGLFTMFHGTSSVGGGFQGGVVVAAGVVTVAFSFGIDQARQWLDDGVLTLFVVSGVVTFAVVAVGGVLLGTTFLGLEAYRTATGVEKAVVYAVELVELGIGATVATTILVMVTQLGRASSGDEGGGPRR